MNTRYIVDNLSNQTITGNLIVNGTISGGTFYGGSALAGTNYASVATSGTPTENGALLVAQYEQAILQEPNGLPLSETNRYTILIAPGEYNLPYPLTASTKYIDLVSTSGQKDVFISASTTPILVLTDDIKLVGLSVCEYDLDILYELKNIIVVNSGNNLYTINRDVKKEEKQYYYSWSVTSGEPYPLASTSGYVTYLNIDNSTYENSNRYMLFNIGGSVRLKDSIANSIIGGNFDFINEEQVGQTTNVGYASYDTLLGSLNVGDILEFSGTSGTFTGETLYDTGTDVYFSFISGVFNNDETLLTNLTNSSTANILSFNYPIELIGNQTANFNINSNGTFMNTSLSLNSFTPGICSVIYNAYPSFQAFVIFSGNPVASFYGDTQITNDLGGTASIGIDTQINFLGLTSLSGTWVGATTITGDITSNTRSITKFSDTWELNIKTELFLDSQNVEGNTYKI